MSMWIFVIVLVEFGSSTEGALFFFFLLFFFVSFCLDSLIFSSSPVLCLGAMLHVLSIVFLHFVLHHQLTPFSFFVTHYQRCNFSFLF